MGKFLRALAKVGLVELDDSKRGEPELTPEATENVAQDSEVPAEDTQAVAVAEIAEEQPLEAIYAAAQLPSTTFPAEKLLKLLDGLRVMDAVTRKAAVLAMDAADDSWAIEDPVEDAQRKIGALVRHKGGLVESLAAAEARTKKSLADQDRYQEQATSEIRRQIAELEQMLQTEIHNVAQEKANQEANLRATREAHARENARLDREIRRLEEIPLTFGAPKLH